jgi:hypothetical protein
MRKMDWEKPLSDEDIAFLRQSGIPDTEGIIARHQAKFDVTVPEEEVPEDTGTKSALDPSATALGDPIEGIGQGSPQLIDPTKPVDEMADDEDEGDDYDQWNKVDLENEVEARNALENSGPVEVIGTGKDGNVLKPDLVKGLRLWDQENPRALD